jgi:hypothetical protein
MGFSSHCGAGDGNNLHLLRSGSGVVDLQRS